MKSKETIRSVGLAMSVFMATALLMNVNTFVEGRWHGGINVVGAIPFLVFAAFFVRSASKIKSDSNV